MAETRSLDSLLTLNLKVRVINRVTKYLPQHLCWGLEATQGRTLVPIKETEC